MSSIATPAAQSPLPIGKALKWLAVAALVGCGLYFYVQRPIQYFRFNETSYGYYWPHRLWLVAHLLGGSLALLTGPFQLFTGLRRKSLHIHRWIGKVYLGGVLLGGGAALYMGAAVTSKISWNFSLSLYALAVAWLTCGAMAYVAIRNRNIPIHKEWMIRSYVLTYAFVTFRIILDLPVLAQLPVPERLGIIGWLCWAPPLFFTEVALQWKRTTARR